MRPIGRAALLTVLAVSAVGPLVLLGLTSVAADWFAPAPWPTTFTADAWRSLAGGGRLVGAVVTSALVAATVGVLAALIAVPIGHAIARLTGWGRRLGLAALYLPVATPPIALGLGLQFAFLRAGLGGTTLGVALAHLVPAASFVGIYFAGVFRATDPRLEDEARSLGAAPGQVWRRVILPPLAREIADGVALGALISWAQVPLSLVIGGGLVHTLPLEVYSYLRSGESRYGAVASLLLIVPPVMILAAGRLAATRVSRYFAPALTGI